MTDLPFLPVAVLDCIAHIAVSDVNHFYLSGKSGDSSGGNGNLP